jgi:site-specific DNA-methyltransferase (adenine-specific)
MMSKYRCPRCGHPLTIQATGRRRRYCSNACRQAAYWRRSRRSIHFSSASAEWSTRPELFAELDREFSFTLDACATAENAKCANYFTRQQNGLAQPWTGRVFCNPPYGRGVIGDWVRKAWESFQSGQAEIVVLLVPSRTDTAWWHDYCLQGEVRFRRGRERCGNAKSGAPFPSAVVVFRKACAPDERDSAVVVFRQAQKPDETDSARAS